MNDQERDLFYIVKEIRQNIPYAENWDRGQLEDFALRYVLSNYQDVNELFSEEEI